MTLVVYYTNSHVTSVVNHMSCHVTVVVYHMSCCVTVAVDHMSSHVTVCKVSCDWSCDLPLTADEPDTPGLDLGVDQGGGGGGGGGGGEGGGGGGTQPKHFNQVMLQAQNRMVLIAVLSDQKEKASQTGFTGHSCITRSLADMRGSIGQVEGEPSSQN